VIEVEARRASLGKGLVIFGKRERAWKEVREEEKRLCAAHWLGT